MTTTSTPLQGAADGVPAMRDTSARALDAIGGVEQKNQLEKICDICARQQRAGAADLSGKEVQRMYELIYSERIEAGTVSARINALVAAKRLERLSVTRACTVTGRDIHPVRVPVTQARFSGHSF